MESSQCSTRVIRRRLSATVAGLSTTQARSALSSFQPATWQSALWDITCSRSRASRKTPMAGLSSCGALEARWLCEAGGTNTRLGNRKSSESRPLQRLRCEGEGGRPARSVKVGRTQRAHARDWRGARGWEEKGPGGSPRSSVHARNFGEFRISPDRPSIPVTVLILLRHWRNLAF
jgi:hypothetical protein